MTANAADEALSHIQITSLLSRYYHAIDVANWSVLDQEILADDALWQVIQNSPSGDIIEDVVQGRSEILGWFEQLMSSDLPLSEGVARHFVGTHDVIIDGSHARSTSCLQAVSTATLETLANGLVEAEYVQTERGWRISRYKLDEHISDTDMKIFKGLRKD